MRTIAKFIVMFVAIALLFSSCVKLESVEQIEDDGFALQTVVSANGSYIVVHNAGDLSLKAKAGIEKAGGTVKETFQQIGVTIVTSDSPEFARSAGKALGVSFVEPDLLVALEAPEGRLFVQSEIDNLVSENWISDNDLPKVKPAFSVPSDTPAALSINATGPDDSLAFYSNYGAAETLVVASGGDISYPPYSYCLSAYSPLNAWAPGAEYAWSIGTSMTTPKVSGVAALIYAQNPGISVSQVKSILSQTAELLVKQGFDSMFGHGIVNA